MQVRIFTMAFDPRQESFPDEELCAFLLNKQVSMIRSEFFITNGKPYWTVLVQFETVVSQEKHALADLDEGQQLLFKRLRQWRKTKAEKEGVPVFIIATNQQLVQVVHRKPLTQKALREINGFGKKKVERYGQEIVALVRTFYEKTAANQGAARAEAPDVSGPEP